MEIPVEFAITKQPENVAVAEGEMATVTFEVSGEGLTYQWWFSNSNNGSTFYPTTSFTSNKYEVEMNASRNGRRVYCVVTDSSGNRIQTDTVTITMQAPVEFVITKQPESVTVAEGEMATVTFEVVGEGLTYQWWFSNSNNGSTFYPTTSFTSNVYEVEMNATRDGRRIYCVITDAYGNTLQTDTVTLSMQAELRYGDFVYEAADSGIIIVKYEGSSSSVTVPATIDDLPVIRIGDSAFEGNTTVTSIDLPDSIQTIGTRAFANCTNLSEVK